jgi:hydroxymethylpyrimidine pyrophosphatase-like HAD family hydrolase
MANEREHTGPAIPSDRLTFAFDYDGTVSRNPALFRKMRDLIVQWGGRVVVVTGRSGSLIDALAIENALGSSTPVVYAGGDWKRDAAARWGWKVDVWVDDWPEWVGDAVISHVTSGRRLPAPERAPL